jgi:threonine dehydrogenase-like Zn-dependent dehydrogenase
MEVGSSRKGTAITDVIGVIGPGPIGLAIARRVGGGKNLLLADVRQENVDAAAEVLGNAGYGRTALWATGRLRSSRRRAGRQA